MLKELSRDALLELLEDRSGRRGNIYNFILNNRFISAFSLNNSLLFTGESDNIWGWIDSDSEKDTEALLNRIPYIDTFGWMGGVAEKYILSNRNTDWILKVRQYVLPGDTDVSTAGNICTDLLSDDADYIFQNSIYNKYTDPDYIKTRIQNGESSCIRVDGKLVAWGLTHDDGAMGFLHVMPQYRGKGFAQIVTSDLILKLRSKGLAAYVQIEDSNKASLGLTEKFGFIHQCSLSWFKIVL